MIGGPWLVGITAILHVYVSHFAVGGGLYLYLTERKALRENDDAMRAHVRRYTKFFYYLTTVFGAISGVGIWFAIGLVSAPGTSTLIHNFVFVWACEWVFFAVEIGSIMVYHYTWDTLDKQTHLKVGKLYAIASVATLALINGILGFMLTPGRWVETKSVWDGFFNPTYFPAMFLRLAFMFSLGGLFGVAVASRIRDNEGLRTRLAHYSASFTIPLLLSVPFLVFWYLKSLPPDVVYNMRIGMTTPALGNFSMLARMMTGAAMVALLTVGFTVAGPLLNPRNVTTWGTTLLLVMAGMSMGMSEWSREAARKPYVIYGYMYSNGVLKADAPKYANGFLRHAKWVNVRSADGLTGTAKRAAGAEMFRSECMACHTTSGYRGMNRVLATRDEAAIRMFLDLIHYGSKGNPYRTYMPPFLGSAAERDALAAYLATLNREERAAGTE